MSRPLLEKKSQLRAEHSGAQVIIGDRLGGGGQGEVYAAEMAGYPVAVKWYFPAIHVLDPRLRDRLQTAILRGAPSSAFLWPADLVVTPTQSGFGYVMPLREPRFRGFLSLMMGEISPSFRVLATAGYELTEGYRILHGAGLCYRDISFGNVSLDPATGEIKICDNDNVDVNGTPGSVFGTPMFMAPEIVQGVALPSTRTDLWSLAVLLFHAFVQHHPLIGRRELGLRVLDAAGQRLLFGTAARFIFDPDDRSNEPVPGTHDNALAFWPIYPTFFRRLFIRAFTEGLRDPGRRVLEAEWRNAMVLLRDSIMRCPRCTAENFHDTEVAGTRTCWSCKRDLPQPRSISIGNTRVVLTEGTSLFPHHLDPARRLNFSAPLAAFSRNPTRPELVGLTNLSSQCWQAMLPDGQERQIQQGRTVVLRPGTRIAFGRVEGVVA